MPPKKGKKGSKKATIAVIEDEDVAAPPPEATSQNEDTDVENDESMLEEEAMEEDDDPKSQEDDEEESPTNAKKKGPKKAAKAGPKKTASKGGGDEPKKGKGRATSSDREGDGKANKKGKKATKELPQTAMEKSPAGAKAKEIVKSPWTKENRPSVPRKTQSSQAGLIFPVTRVHKYLKKGQYAQRVHKLGAVYLTSVLEYLVAEVLEVSGDASRDNNRSRIMPRHIMLALRNDTELDELTKHVTFPGGGVLPHIAAELLPKKSVKTGHSSQDKESQEY